MSVWVKVKNICVDMWYVMIKCSEVKFYLLWVDDPNFHQGVFFVVRSLIL